MGSEMCIRDRINRRQFGGVSPKHGMGLTSGSSLFVPEGTVWPDVVYQDEMKLSVGASI